MTRTLAALLLLSMPWLAHAEGAPFLWQVHGAKATHYLLGSVHLQPSGSGALPPAIVEAYKQSRGLVFETDIEALQSSGLRGEFSKRGMAGAGGLRGEVGDALYAQTATALRKLRLPAGFCDQLRAWLCGMSVELVQWKRAGFDGAEGIDERLYAVGRREGKTLRWFEPPLQHMGLFTEMPPDIAREFLRSSFDEDSSSPDSPDALYRAWLHNDTAAITALVDDMRKQYPKTYERLLLARNRSWQPQLLKLLESDEPQLIVVGAAHYLGRDGLLALLRAKGYTAIPVEALAPQEAAMLAPAQAMTP